MAKLTKIAVVFPKKVGASEEKALAKVLDAIADAKKRVDGLLASVGKTKPMPKPLADAVAKRETIAKGREAELRDLEKSRKRNELHTNPSKLQRVFNDLNEDIAQANWLEGGVGKFMETHYDEKTAELVKGLKPLLPAGVTAGQIKLADMVEALKKLNKKEAWGKFDANAKTFVADVKERARAAEIVNMRDDTAFKELKQGTRDSIINKAKDDPKISAAQARLALAAALTKQKKPSKSRWANYLGLGADGSYRLNAAGDFDGYKIHWTMSNDSWTAAADGAVDLTVGTPAKVLENLLKSKAGLQLHATLEVGAMSDYPHVYLYAGAGNAAKWNQAAATAKAERKPKNPAGDWETKWIAAAQKALTKVMDDIKRDLENKVAAAQRTVGSTF